MLECYTSIGETQKCVQFFSVSHKEKKVIFLHRTLASKNIVEENFSAHLLPVRLNLHFSRSEKISSLEEGLFLRRLHQRPPFLT